MTPSLPFSFLRTALLFLLPLLGGRAFGSHISGVDIRSECLGGNTYLITLNLFRDRRGIMMNTTKGVELMSD